MYFQGKKTEQNKIEDTLEKAGGEETMSDKLKVNMNEYLPLRDVVFNTLRQAIITGEFAPGERLMEIALANRLESAEHQSEKQSVSWNSKDL